MQHSANKTILGPAALRIRRLGVALLLGGLCLWNSGVRAEEIGYAKVGWWRVTYRAIEDVIGCDATVEFNDQTVFSIALLQDDERQAWFILLNNPKWQWVGAKKEHRLVLLGLKNWRGVFTVISDGVLMSDPLSADFVNDLVATDGLALANENRRILTPSRLSMKDSAAAISAVKKCVEEHPNQLKQPSQQEVTVSGTGFFVASGFVITNNHVVDSCTKPIQVRYPEGSSEWQDAVALSPAPPTKNMASQR